jgi:hypothetical protein
MSLMSLMSLVSLTKAKTVNYVELLFIEKLRRFIWSRDAQEDFIGY